MEAARRHEQHAVGTAARPLQRWSAWSPGSEAADGGGGRVLRPRVKLFGVDIDAIKRQDAVALLSDWLSDDRRENRIVVTPNVHHVVKLDRHQEFRQAYAAASLVLADGWPLVAVSRMFGEPLPDRVTGSDLVPAVFDYVSAHWQRPMRVFLLGAAPGVADRAARRIEAEWRNVVVAGTHSPPFGFGNDPEACRKVGERVAAAQADLLVIGLGAPLQEVWSTSEAGRLNVKVAVCAGATIDFLAGEKARAPIWMRHVGLEWLHRLLSEPRRLSRRYAHDAVHFPRLVWREWLDRRRS